MSAKTYNILMRIMAVVLAMLVAVSIVMEAPFYYFLVAVMLALVLSYVLRRSVKEIMTDERSRRIDEKATSMAFRIYSIVTMVFVLVVISFRSSLPSWVSDSGTTLAYSLCGLLLVHQVCTKYFAKKL